MKISTRSEVPDRMNGILKYPPGRIHPCGNRITCGPTFPSGEADAQIMMQVLCCPATLNPPNHVKGFSTIRKKENSNFFSEEDKRPSSRHRRLYIYSFLFILFYLFGSNVPSVDCNTITITQHASRDIWRRGIRRERERPILYAPVFFPWADSVFHLFCISSNGRHVPDAPTPGS